MKFSALVFISLWSITAFAQDSTAPPDSNPGHFSPATLASEFFEHDFFNFFAFGDGIYDDYEPIVGPNGQRANNSSLGFSVGGGVNGYHTFHNATLSLSYSGDYREYQNNIYGSGTDQSLGLSYSKRLTRRLSFSFSQYAGISYYGSYLIPSGPNQISNNPFSPETKFLSSSLGITYQQTRRLSYSVGGSFFLQRYNYPGSIGTTGGSGSASVNYRVSPRVTVGGSYSHMDFSYQRGAGTAQADTVAATLSRVFPQHWTVSLSGGATRSNVSGTAVVPVTLLIGTQAVGGYAVGKYAQTSTFPSYSGSVSRSFRRSTFGVNAGEGIAAGNGYFLASKQLFINGVASYSLRHSNFSATGAYSRLSSVANAVSSAYSSSSLSLAYSVSLRRHFGTNLRYDYLRYGGLAPYGGISDSRVSFGFTYSSKSIPLTLY